MSPKSNGDVMMSARTVRIVALLLAVVAGLVFIFGYDFVHDQNIRPQESTIDWMV